MAIDQQIIETKKVNVNKDCLTDGICLKWLNTLGGWDIWVFSKKHIITTDVSNTEHFNKFVEDLEGSTGNMHIIRKRSFDVYKLGADGLNKAKYYDGLKGLKNTPLCYMLMNPLTWGTEGCKWMRVMVLDSKLDIDNNEPLFNIEVDIQLSDKIINI